MTRRNGTPNRAGCFFSRRWTGDLFNGLEGNVGIGCKALLPVPHSQPETPTAREALQERPRARRIERRTGSAVSHYF